MSSECLCRDKSLYYSENELTLVQECEVPKHVGIIMDGNRRWAKRQVLSKITDPLIGHWAGANVLIPIVEAAYDLGIKVLTVYAFSTENWSRPPHEIEMLLHIFEVFLKENLERMVLQGVRFQVIGDLAPFSHSLKKEISNALDATKHCDGIDFVVGLNYGGRDEMRRAVQAIVDDVQKGVLQESISESLIGRYLDTAKLGELDLLIRTSGEMRVSNFLLWQLAYAEIYITDVLWPDFTPRDLLHAVLAFQKRQRRVGR